MKSLFDLGTWKLLQLMVLVCVGFLMILDMASSIWVKLVPVDPTAIILGFLFIVWAEVKIHREESKK